jgi:hypothetical protein
MKPCRAGADASLRATRLLQLDEDGSLLGVVARCPGSANELATSANRLSAVSKSDKAETSMSRVCGHTMAIRRAGCAYRPSHNESDYTGLLFDYWHDYKAGKLDRATFRTWMAPVRT